MLFITILFNNIFPTNNMERMRFEDRREGAFHMGCYCCNFETKL